MKNNKLRTIAILEEEPDGMLAQIASSTYPQAQLLVTHSWCEARKLLNKNKPELAIIDLDCVEGDGADFIKSLKQQAPETTLVVATYIENDRDIFFTLKAGAKGYLLKDKETDQIQKHLVNILEGQPTVAPAIAYQMLGYFHRQPNFDVMEALSDRESEILALIASGDKRAEVAEKLNISLNTVATHLKAVYSKLKINSRAEATLEAIRRGLIKKPS